MPRKWRKKPVVVEAERFDGTNHDAIVRFAGAAARVVGNGSGLVIDTLEGPLRVSPGDYVIRGTAGEFYPCKPDVFAAIYDPAEENA